MRKVGFVLVLLAAALTALSSSSVAGAAECPPSGCDVASASIDQRAHFVNGQSVNVVINYRCTGEPGGPGGRGSVLVTLDQTPQQSNNGIGGNGSGGEFLNCDGTHRSVAVTVFGFPGYNLGEATVTAFVGFPNGETVELVATVLIVP